MLLYFLNWDQGASKPPLGSKYRGLSTGSVRHLAAMTFALLLGGCASQPLVYPIRATGEKVINRDEGGNALSVVVRMYELTDRKAFSKLTLDDMSSGKSDEDLFGEEFVKRSEVVVMPGRQAIHDAQLQPDTRFVGVVAMFRQPDLDHWRYLIPADRIRSNSSGLGATLANLFAAPEKSTQGLLFTVKDCSIMVVAPEPELLPGQRPHRTGNCPTVLSDDAGSPPSSGSSSSSSMVKPKSAPKPARRNKTTSANAGND